MRGHWGLWLTVLLSMGVAAGAVEIRVEAGFEGYAKQYTWMPVRVTLDNQGAPVRGELVIPFQTPQEPPYVARYCRRVNLPSPAHQVYTFYLPATTWKPEIGVEWQPERDPKKIVRGGVKLLGWWDRMVLVVGPQRSALMFLNGTRIKTAFNPHPPTITMPEMGPVSPFRTRWAEVRVVHASEEELPNHWLGYQGVDAVVLVGLRARTLSPAQEQALAQWVRRGGRMVACGGVEAAYLTAPFFRELLGIEVQGLAALASLPTPWPGGTRVGWLQGRFPVTQVRAREGEVLAQGEVPLLIRRPWGHGWVYFLAFSPRASPLQEQPEAVSFWHEVLGLKRSAKLNLWVYADKMSSAVARLPARRTPSLSVVGGYLLLYLLLLVPANYFLLRRLRQLEWSWLTIPLIVALFTAGAYAIGSHIKGRALRLRSLSLVVGRAGEQEAPAFTVFGLYSPRRARYDLRLPGAAPAVKEYSGEMLASYHQSYRQRGSLDVVQEEVPELRGVKIDMWAMRLFGVETLADLGEGLEAQLVYKDGNLYGTITNRTLYTFAPAGVTVGGINVNWETFAPGETKEIRLLSPLFSGEAPLAVPEEVEFDPEVLNEFCNGRYYYPSPPGLTLRAPKVGEFWGPNFWGWTRQAVTKVQVKGHQPEESHLALFYLSLPVRTLEGKVVVLPETCTWEVIGQTEASVTRGAVHLSPQGRVGLQFMLPEEARRRSLHTAEVHLRVNWAQKVRVSAYNRRWGRWRMLREVGVGYHRLPLRRPEDYFDPASGIVKLRLENRPSGGEVNIGLIDLLVVVE